MTTILVLGAVGALLLVASNRVPLESVIPQEAFHEPLWQTPEGGRVEVHDDGRSVELVIPEKRYDERQRINLSHPFVVPTDANLVAFVQTMGSVIGDVRVEFLFSSSKGQVCRIVWLPVTASDSWIPTSVNDVRVPDNARVVSVAVRIDEGTTCSLRLRRLDLKKYRTWVPAAIHRQLLFLGRRFSAQFDAGRTENLMHVASLDFRIRETKRLLSVFVESPLSARVFGHGLGARYRFQARGSGSLGRQTVITDPNYIHNFYAFLLFKLGVVGTLIVLCSFGAWLGWAVHRLRGILTQYGACLVSAYIAIWVAYLAWGLFCPELIDFRVAPVVGFLIAAVGTLEVESPIVEADDAS
jgi:hypothetical protein